MRLRTVVVLLKQSKKYPAAYGCHLTYVRCDKNATSQMLKNSPSVRTMMTTMTNIKRILLLPILLLLEFAVEAHVEDYLIQSGTGTIANFYERTTVLVCTYNTTRPLCRTTAAVDSLATFTDVSNYRGAVHYDGVFIMAQAVGFTSEMAYWLAAFAQAVDFIQFKGLDQCGIPLPNMYWTPPLRGYVRTSVVTGGTATHLGVPFGLTKPYEDYTGLNPDLTNFEYEGTLSTFRLWARGETDLACIAGFREPSADGNYFLGDTCLITSKTLDSSNVSPLVSGPIPLAGGPMQFGEQIIHYDCDPNCTDTNFQITNPVMASDFEAYLAQNAMGPRGTNKLQDGNPVPLLIAKMGIYMHLLADRTSHYYCTDVEGKSAIVHVNGGEEDDLALYLDTHMCNAVMHGSEHSWEQGVDQPLAPQSYAALQLYYQELLSFRKLVETSHPTWFIHGAVPKPYKDMVGTVTNPGVLDRAFVLRDAQDRFNAILAAIDQFGFDRPPGFEKKQGEETKKGSSCKFPIKFAKVKNPMNRLSTSAARLAVSNCTGVSVTDVVALTGEQYSQRYYPTKRGKKDTLYISFTPNVVVVQKLTDVVKMCKEQFCLYQSLAAKEEEKDEKGRDERVRKRKKETTTTVLMMLDRCGRRERERETRRN